MKGEAEIVSCRQLEHDALLCEMDPKLLLRRCGGRAEGGGRSCAGGVER